MDEERQDIVIDVRATLPEITDNLDELRDRLVERCEGYRNMDVTEANLRDAKDELAMLRKAKKAFEEKRLGIRKDVLKPYSAFEDRYKQVMAPLDEAIDSVSSKVKAVEDARDADKLEEIKEFIDETFGKTEDDELFPYADKSWVIDRKWLNKGCADSVWKTAVENRVKTVRQALDIIKRHPYAAQVLAKFDETGDLAEALAYGTELQEQAEANALKVGAKTPASAVAADPDVEFSVPVRKASNDAQKTVVEYTCRITGPAYVVAALRDGLVAHGCSFEKVSVRKV